MRNQHDLVVVAKPGKTSHLYIVRGIPGAGKSTYAKELQQMGHAPCHIEADMYFERTGKYLFDMEKLHAAHNWCLTTVQVLLNQGNRVVVANTFTTYKEVKDYVNYAKLNGHGVTLVTMNNNFGSVHNVPEETMQRMRERFEDHDTIRDKIQNA